MLRITGRGVSTGKNADGIEYVVVEHPQGLPVDGKRLINVSTGLRSERKKPYYSIYVDESSSFAATSGGHTKVIQIWGEFAEKDNVKSAITWQQKIDPEMLVDVLDMNIQRADVVDCMLLNLSKADLAEFAGMAPIRIQKELTGTFGFELLPIGEFVSIPSDHPFLKDFVLEPFRIAGTGDMAAKSTEFVFRENLKSQLGILRTFGRAGRIVKDASKGNRVIMSPDILDNERKSIRETGSKTGDTGVVRNMQSSGLGGEKNGNAANADVEAMRKKHDRMIALEDIEANKPDSLNPAELDELAELQLWYNANKAEIAAALEPANP